MNRKRIIQNILLLIFLSFNISCAQTLNKSDEAKNLINEGAEFMGIGRVKKNPPLSDNNQNISKAITLFEKSIQIDSSRRLAFQLLSNCYTKIGDKNKTIQTISRWIKIDSNDIGMRTTRALFYERIQDTVKANVDYNKLQGLLSKEYIKSSSNAKNDTEINDINAIAMIYFIINKKEEATSILNRLEQKYPNEESIKKMIKELNNLNRNNYINGITGY